MIKKIAWDTFKITGNINTFLEFKQIENIEKNMKEKAKGELEQNGKSENKWNSSI